MIRQLLSEIFIISCTLSRWLKKLIRKLFILIRQLSIAISLLLLFSVLFYQWWNSGELTTNFDPKFKERSEVVALIKSDQLGSDNTYKKKIKRSNLDVSQIELPKQYKNLAMFDYIIVVEKDNILEIYFPLKTAQFGDSTMYFVYNSDPRLEEKKELEVDDFLYLTEGDFFEAKKVAPQWYQVMHSF